MSTIVLRQTKGSALTFAEGDANFSNLNNDKLEDITNESIGDLSDVNTTSIGDGQALLWDEATSTFIPGDAGANLASSSINDLGDVAIDSVGDGEALVYNSSASAWKNQTIVSVSALTDLSDIDPSLSPFDGQILVWDNANSRFTADYPSGMAELVDDLTPELGGDLNCGDNAVISPVLKDYAETIYNLGTTDSPTITVANGNVQKLTITSGLSLPAFSDAAAGQSVTLLVDGSGTVTGTLDYLFAGGANTLTTSSVISIFYDGTIYWASVNTDFQ